MVDGKEPARAGKCNDSPETAHNAFRAVFAFGRDALRPDVSKRRKGGSRASGGANDAS